MAVTLAATPKERLSLGYNGTGTGVCGYNGQPYDAILNPGGMDGNGVAVNWINMCADMVAIGLTAAQMVQMVTSYLAGVNGWTQEVAAISRLSSAQFTVPGDKTLVYKVTRALSVFQSTPGTGHVSMSSYSAGTGLTTVTVSGITIDAGLSEIWLGQDPDNAPAIIPETTLGHLDFRVTSGCPLVPGGRYRAFLSTSQTFSLPIAPGDGDTVEIWDCGRTFGVYPAVITGSVRGDAGGATLDLISRTVFSYDATRSTWDFSFVVED